MLSKVEKGLLSSKNGKYSKPRNPTEIYGSLLNKTDASFEILKDIFLGIDVIHRDSTKLKPISNAKQLEKKISNEEIQTLLVNFFQAKNKSSGSSTALLGSVSENFSFKKLKHQKLLLLSTFMLNLSLSYLQQSFSSTEYLILKRNIEQITEDVQNLTLAYEEKMALEKQINSYKKLFDRTEPSNTIYSEMYQCTCIFCYSINSGESLLETVDKIEHTKKCRYLEEWRKDPNKKEKNILKWIRITKDGKKIKQKLHDEILGIKKLKKI
jgi:hypothetical protein